MPRLYSAYGCVVASELALPSLPEVAGEADACVRFGRAPDCLPDEQGRGVCFSAAPGEALVSIDGIARFHVIRGAEIVVDAARGVDSATLELFLTHLAFGLLLHQRGEIVLHAAAVQHGDACVALAGASGAGEPSVAAALERRGHRVVTDEICVVRREGADHVVLPGPPRLHVWADALRRLGHDPGPLAAVRPGLQKYAFPLGRSHANETLPLKAIYVLQPWEREDIDLVTLTGLRRFEALASATYRPEYIRPMGLAVAHFQCLSSLSSVPVSLIKNPRTWRSMDAMLQRLAGDATDAP